MTYYKFSLDMLDDLEGVEMPTFQKQSNNLQELIVWAKLNNVNDYHHTVIEYCEPDEDDMYGPERLAIARLFEIEPHMKDLSEFIV